MCVCKSCNGILTPSNKNNSVKTGTSVVTRVVLGTPVHMCTVYLSETEGPPNMVGALLEKLFELRVFRLA